MTRFTGILITAAVLFTLVVGCANVAEKAAEKAVEKAAGVEVDKRGEEITIKGKEGESVTISTKVPDELKNFPVPSGFQSKEGASVSSGQSGDNVAVASWSGKSGVDKVVDFYKKTLLSQGWMEAATFSAGDAAMLSYEKAPDQTVTITLDKSNDEVEINVLLGKSTNR